MKERTEHEEKILLECWGYISKKSGWPLDEVKDRLLYHYGGTVEHATLDWFRNHVVARERR